MHDTAYAHGGLFFELYWDASFADIVELGSQDVNGTLRDHRPPGARYLGLDLAPGKGVDVVVSRTHALPLADGSADVVVTSSAFEHDTMFWETFLELLRILRPGGLLYVNAPSNGTFHRYPLDCWRFYPDAGPALVAWAAHRGTAVELVEAFVAAPGKEGWADFVGVFRKPDSSSLTRRGRIADRTTAANIHDGPASSFEAGGEATFDMQAAAALRAELAEARAEAGAAREEAIALAAAVATLRADLAVAVAERADFATAASAARREAEAALRTVHASVCWRVTAPLRWFSAQLWRQG